MNKVIYIGMVVVSLSLVGFVVAISIVIFTNNRKMMSIVPMM